jgi:hypothetical protein
MILDTTISVFRTARSTEPATARLGAFLDSRKYRDRVLEVRAAADKDARNALKKELPAATVSGVFTRRNAAGLAQYNGLVCLDFDAADNPGRSAEEMRAILAEFDEVAYAGLSVSGQGVFAIIATNNTDPAQHGRVVDILGTVLAECDIYYDRACKDVCRLRFVSYDPAAHYNTAPAAFDARAMLAAADAQAAHKPRPIYLPKPPGTDTTTEKKVVALIEKIEATAADVTTVYDDWMRLGMALASEFGAGGEAYFHRISRYHSEYDHAECAKKYANFVRHTARVRIGTFFKILTEKNIRL